MAGLTAMCAGVSDAGTCSVAGLGGEGGERGYAMPSTYTSLYTSVECARSREQAVKVTGPLVPMPLPCGSPIAAVRIVRHQGPATGRAAPDRAPATGWLCGDLRAKACAALISFRFTRPNHHNFGCVKEKLPLPRPPPASAAVRSSSKPRADLLARQQLSGSLHTHLDVECTPSALCLAAQRFEAARPSAPLKYTTPSATE